jgi:HK97 family phage portal protein
MGLLSRVMASTQDVMTSADIAKLLGRSWQTKGGAEVSYDSAMQVADVYKCVRILAEDMAKLPLQVYRRTSTGKEKANDHWLQGLLDTPNPWQTGFEFRELAQAHVELAGNAYAIKTVVRNETRELLPISPNSVRVELLADRWELLYHVTMPDGSYLPVPADRMFHYRGFSLDGWVGLSPVRYQREAIGLNMQLVEHGARLFKNGASVLGVMQHPTRMSQEAYDRLKSSFEETYAGVGNAHKTVLLEEGTTYAKTGMTADEAQFLESRKFSRGDIAGIFRVPPHKIGDLEHATFTNIEQQSIEYGTDSLMPRAVRLEARIARSLIAPRERGEVFAKLQLNGLLRGDYAARTNGYRSAIMAGWMNRNEARELEDMNPKDGLDEFLTPLNMDDGSADPSKQPDRPQPPPRREPTP